MTFISRSLNFDCSSAISKKIESRLQVIAAVLRLMQCVSGEEVKGREVKRRVGMGDVLVERKKFGSVK